MTEVMIIIAKCLGAIAVGTIAGNGAVYFFNRIPARWLCDYGQEPDEELLHPTRQRVRSTPWKYVFSGLFIAIGIYLAIDSPLYALAAVERARSGQPGLYDIVQPALPDGQTLARIARTVVHLVLGM